MIENCCTKCKWYCYWDLWDLPCYEETCSYGKPVDCPVDGERWEYAFGYMARLHPVREQLCKGEHFEPKPRFLSKEWFKFWWLKHKYNL